ncbi:MAG: hypothetical protein AAGN46_03140 [Acidobacteriota bacterium]
MSGGRPRQHASNDLSPEVARRLRVAPAAELLELVREHALRFGLREVRQVVRNPFVDAAVLEELASVRRLMVTYEARAVVARHRRTPEAVAMRFLAGLFWRELMEIALDARVRAAVRRVAEKYLLQRLERLTVGERVALARRGPSSIVARLVADPSARVVRAAFGNPRLTEEGLLRAFSLRSTPRWLELVAADERFGPRYDVQVALSRHPMTPARVLLAALPRLRREDLEAVVAVEEHSRWFRARASEHLSARDGDDASDLSDGLNLGDNLEFP